MIPEVACSPVHCRSEAASKGSSGLLPDHLQPERFKPLGLRRAFTEGPPSDLLSHRLVRLVLAGIIECPGDSVVKNLSNRVSGIKFSLSNDLAKQLLGLMAVEFSSTHQAPQRSNSVIGPHFGRSFWAQHSGEHLVIAEPGILSHAVRPDGP